MVCRRSLCWSLPENWRILILLALFFIFFIFSPIFLWCLSYVVRSSFQNDSSKMRTAVFMLLFKREHNNATCERRLRHERNASNTRARMRRTSHHHDIAQECYGLSYERLSAQASPRAGLFPVFREEILFWIFLILSLSVLLFFICFFFLVWLRGCPSVHVVFGEIIFFGMKSLVMEERWRCECHVVVFFVPFTRTGRNLPDIFSDIFHTYFRSGKRKAACWFLLLHILS